MYAYDPYIIGRTQDSLGWMFEYGVNVYGLKLEEFYQHFLNSNLSDGFESGSSRVVMGMSGTEIAMEVIRTAKGEETLPEPIFTIERSPEFWTGWALAYYQWVRNLSFRKITEVTPISDIYLMYRKYHEMDITQFVDELDRRREDYLSESTLKRLRRYAGLSQKELAEETGIPVRTIQQYEQGQKDIKKANVDYIVRLSKSLYCTIEDIIM